MHVRICTFAALTAAALAAPALADFSGQPILGPITLGSSVTGDTTGHGDENDGFFSGDHIFDIWDGGDDVWQLNWPGGDLELRLTYMSPPDDPDMFLYFPGHLDESSIDAVTGGGLDIINVPGAAAGTYFVLIDCVAGTEGPYRIDVVPAPGAASLFACSAIVGLRRRQRR